MGLYLCGCFFFLIFIIPQMTDLDIYGQFWHIFILYLLDIFYLNLVIAVVIATTVIKNVWTSISAVAPTAVIETLLHKVV